MPAIDWADLALCIFGSVFFGVAIYHAVAGFYHVRYYVRRRSQPEQWKCQARRFLTEAQHRNAMLTGTLNLTLGGVVTGILIYALTRGWIQTPIYTEVADYGWTYTLASTAALFVMIDASAYYVHRALHSRFLYRTVHHYHHSFIATSPYVATALHPFELLWLQAASFLPLFLFPVHAVSIAVVLIYILVFNIIDHSGVRLTSSLPWQGPSTYHDDHHAFFHCNFGQHLMIWDRLHGTLRRQKRTSGKDVFGGKGLADGEQAEALAPFVAY
jgi:lathosterol oxidase